MASFFPAGRAIGWSNVGAVNQTERPLQTRGSIQDKEVVPCVIRAVFFNRAGQGQNYRLP